jgi:hypothetical protein
MKDEARFASDGMKADFPRQRVNKSLRRNGAVGFMNGAIL